MNRPDYTQIDPTELEYPRRIIVKFVDNIGIPYEDGVENDLPADWSDSWNQIKEMYPNATLNRLYVSISPVRLQELVKQAQEMDKSYHRVDFLTFFTINLATDSVVDNLVKLLSQWEIIEYAYLEALPGPNPSVPQGAPANPDYLGGLQGYLQPSNYSDPSATFIGGIDAEVAWPLLGASGSGEGISFIDIEKQWNLNNNEWIDASNTSHFGPASLIYGHNYSDPTEPDPQHGTKVLGILAMQDNMIGGVGIARDATGKLVSVWRDRRPGEPPGSLPYVHDLPEAIIIAIDNLNLGDVLLIERQMIPLADATVLHPVEMDPAVFEQIRLATALGITVIEPAGNLAEGAQETVDLDTAVNSLGAKILNRADTSDTSPYRDSGAILVAGAFVSPTSTPNSNPPYPKLFTNRGYWHTNSNYGSRVDCFAWGEGVYTTNGGNTPFGEFGGTSAASSIVAGAAILLQALAKEIRQIPFHPWHLREILTSTGVPPASDNPITKPIGVMPNLKAAIYTALNLTPDVYVRDNPSDDGTLHIGSISASPDVNVYPVNGTGRGSQVTQGVDHEIQVGARNRGPGDATNVRATVYWSLPSTLVTPDSWTKIGTSQIGETVLGMSTTTSTLLEPITWLADDIPAPHHYCFIATIGSNEDPDPVPNHEDLVAMSFDNFQAFIRRNNNVTWRNFNVEEMSDTKKMEMAFMAPGWPSEDLPMQIEVVGYLPKGARLWLVGPAGFMEEMIEFKPFLEIVSESYARVPINPYGANLFREIVFPAKSRNQMQLQVEIPEDKRDRVYEIFVHQLYKGDEVGRVTWQFVPEIKKGEDSFLDWLHRFFAQLWPWGCLPYLLLILAGLAIVYLLLFKLP